MYRATLAKGSKYKAGAPYPPPAAVAAAEAAAAKAAAPLVPALRHVLTADPAGAAEFGAWALNLPGDMGIYERDDGDGVDPGMLQVARHSLERALAAALRPELGSAVLALDAALGVDTAAPGSPARYAVPYSYSAQAAAQRSMRQAALYLLAALGEPAVLADLQVGAPQLLLCAAGVHAVVQGVPQPAVSLLLIPIPPCTPAAGAAGGGQQPDRGCGGGPSAGPCRWGLYWTGSSTHSRLPLQPASISSQRMPPHLLYVVLLQAAPPVPLHWPPFMTRGAAPPPACTPGWAWWRAASSRAAWLRWQRCHATLASSWATQVPAWRCGMPSQVRARFAGSSCAWKGTATFPRCVCSTFLVACRLSVRFGDHHAPG